jgi:DNA-binding transcriptional LysR family regulator
LAARQQIGWPELLQHRWVMPPADCFFYEHVLRTLHQLDLPMPRHAVEAMSIHIQFGLVLHAGLLSFGMRSQVSFAPGKEFLVRLPYELPTSSSAVGAVMLSSHAPSPLAQQLIAHIRALTRSRAPAPRAPASDLAAV